MIRPDSILPEALPIPPKLNINKHIIIASLLGVTILGLLFFTSYFLKIDNSKLIYMAISIMASIAYLFSTYFIYNRKLSYILQWNIERDKFIQKKLNLKKRTIDANVRFIMTSLGQYGNGDFAKKNNSILKINPENKNGMLKNAKLSLFKEDDDIVRFNKIIEYLFLSNVSGLLNKYKLNDVKLLFIDNFSSIEKEIILAKLKELDTEIINNFSFIQSENLSQFLNDLANNGKSEHYFLFGLNINKNIENDGEVAIFIEINSHLKNMEGKIHQAPVIKNDYNLESIINFGNCTPGEIENIWYSNLSNIELSEVSSFFQEGDKSVEPDLINIDNAFGITGELSELLLIAIAIEQTSRSKKPQLIISSPAKNTVRVISNS